MAGHERDPRRAEMPVAPPEPVMSRDDPADAIQRLLALAARGGALPPEEGAELGRALIDLVERIERVAETLRQAAEMVSAQAQPWDVPLTSREVEMLRHLAEGRSNAEIARRCWISENTVKFHLKNLFRKLGIQDRGQATLVAQAISRRLDYHRRGTAAAPAPPAAPGDREGEHARDLKEMLEKLV